MKNLYIGMPLSLCIALVCVPSLEARAVTLVEQAEYAEPHLRGIYGIDFYIGRDINTARANHAKYSLCAAYPNQYKNCKVIGECKKPGWAAHVYEPVVGGASGSTCGRGTRDDALRRAAELCTKDAEKQVGGNCLAAAKAFAFYDDESLPLATGERKRIEENVKVWHEFNIINNQWHQFR